MQFQSKKLNDVWSAYKYGDKYKIVYYKFGVSNVDNSTSAFVKSESNQQNICISEPSEERFANSVSRTKSRIFELASCNEFDYFCTFTQNENLRDRFILSEFRSDLSQFIRNLNRYRVDSEKIKYLLIPEQHKDGAWHMHGLLSGLTDKDLTPFSLKDKLPYKIRKSLKDGVVVYDWVKYRSKFGYFTATKIESVEACSKYITKYVTKDLCKQGIEQNRHLFFASKGLNGRVCAVHHSAEPLPFDDFDFENDFVKIKWVNDITQFV